MKFGHWLARQRPIRKSGDAMSTFTEYPHITPFLWFDSNAEEAADFYVSTFPNSRKLGELRNTGDAPGPKGGVLTVSFELDGLRITALNGGPAYQFTPAVSFAVRCDTQQEIDDYWSKLTAGGKEIQCGWLVDKFGLSWQIVPARLPELIKHPKGMQAMMKMKKLEIAELERASQS
jgi:predicted 3-demethylubiquinone-9 3-methyltransferase (glyoxalase superfamily)